MTERHRRRRWRLPHRRPTRRIGKIYNPSDKKGGTLRFGIAGDWDSVDPGDTYYGLSWNFLRNYARTLVVFKSAPGSRGRQARARPRHVASASPATTTRRGPTRCVTASSSRTAPRSRARTSSTPSRASSTRTTFPNGPTYFNDFLADVPEGYSVYKDKNLDDLKSIETPDAKTIVFKLNKPLRRLRLLRAAARHGPRAAGQGHRHEVQGARRSRAARTSSSTYQPGKRIELVRNAQYDPATDPDSGRKALPDKITVEIGVNAADLDNRLMAGDLDVDIAGTGVQAAAQGKILADPTLKAHTDNADDRAHELHRRSTATSRRSTTSTAARPSSSPHDKTGYQRAYGGDIGGDIATSLLPPIVPGYQTIDLYNFKSKPTGDADAAKAALAKCGQPNGFETNISYRPERPKEKAAAESMQQSLAKVGIKLTLKPYPAGDYFKLYAGKPDYAKANNLGLMVYELGC